MENWIILVCFIFWIGDGSIWIICRQARCNDEWHSITQPCTDDIMNINVPVLLAFMNTLYNSISVIMIIEWSNIIKLLFLSSFLFIIRHIFILLKELQHGFSTIFLCKTSTFQNSIIWKLSRSKFGREIAKNLNILSLLYCRNHNFLELSFWNVLLYRAGALPMLFFQYFTPIDST